MLFSNINSVISQKNVIKMLMMLVNGWQAGKLGGYKAEGPANNSAFQLPSLIAS